MNALLEISMTPPADFMRRQQIGDHAAPVIEAGFSMYDPDGDAVGGAHFLSSIE